MPISFEQQASNDSSNEDVENAGAGGAAEDDEEAFFVTVENEDGEIEIVKVKATEDHKENFDTNKELLQYLQEQGERLPPSLAAELAAGKAPPTALQMMIKKHTTQIMPEGLITSAARGGSGPQAASDKGGGGDSDLDSVQDMEMRRARQRGRSGSIMTPSLIKDLTKNRRRIVAKGGALNIQLSNVEDRGAKFFKDIFNTAIDMQWRYVFAMFFASFLLSWLVFGVFYWLLAIAHGDLEEDNLPSGKNQQDGSFKPCVWAIEDFTGCFLFSVETQHTIGYGSRQTTEECPLAVILMCVQSVIGVIISACQAGIIFAKLARPKARSHTIAFSKNAVVTMRDGVLYLIFRLGNLRKGQLIESHVRAQIIHHKRITLEGEFLHYDHDELRISSVTTGEEPDDRFLLHFPMCISHKIDKESPFYRMGPKEIFNGKFEIFVTLEGIVESTGNSVQSRSSYLPNEILWGHRFRNMINYDKKDGTYVIDCSMLNKTEKDPYTPNKSAREYRLEMKQRKPRKKVLVMKKASFGDEEGAVGAAEDDEGKGNKNSTSSDGSSSSSSSSSSESDGEEK